MLELTDLNGLKVTFHYDFVAKYAEQSGGITKVTLNDGTFYRLNIRYDHFKKLMVSAGQQVANGK